MSAVRQLDRHITDIRTSERWPRLKVHGIPLTYLIDDPDLGSLRDSLCHTNNLEITQARWLIPETRLRERVNQRNGNLTSSTVVITLKNLTAANALVCKGSMWAAGKRRRVELYKNLAADTQCNHCLQFGHHESTCLSPPQCALCAGNHITEIHKCDSRNCAGGKNCRHTPPKCSNCQQSHTATSRRCEIRLTATQLAREQRLQRQKDREIRHMAKTGPSFIRATTPTSELGT